MLIPPPELIRLQTLDKLEKIAHVQFSALESALAIYILEYLWCRRSFKRPNIYKRSANILFHRYNEKLFMIKSE